MIVSLDIVHELLTTIYKKVFSRRRKDINKYEVLLYLDDHYYFDILKTVSKDIHELDNEISIIEKGDFQKIFENVCKKRNYIILNKNYTTENEKRIEFLHELLCDLLCLLHKTKNKKVRHISKIYKCENNCWKTIENHLKDIAGLIHQPINSDNKINEESITKILENINQEHFKNKDVIITTQIDNDTLDALNKLIKKYNNEYKTRFYYLFLNYYLTIQTLFMSPNIDLYSDHIKNIVSKIVHIKKEQYKPLTIYDILAFQYNQIHFYKSSNDTLQSPVKKVKITNEEIERGGLPSDYSKKAIIGNVKNANYSMKEKGERLNIKSTYSHGRHNMEKKYKSRNYYDSRRD